MQSDFQRCSARMKANASMPSTETLLSVQGSGYITSFHIYRFNYSTVVGLNIDGVNLGGMAKNSNDALMQASCLLRFNQGFSFVRGSNGVSTFRVSYVLD